MEKKQVFIILLLLSAPLDTLASPAPVCGRCGPYCDQSRCEGLGVGRDCYFNPDPAVSPGDACRSCSEITECKDYFSPKVAAPAAALNLPKRVGANLCTHDPCHPLTIDCGLSANLECLSCDKVDCGKFLASNCGGCCIMSANQCVRKADDQLNIECKDEQSTVIGEFYQAGCSCDCRSSSVDDKVKICASGIQAKDISEKTGLDILQNRKKACIECNKQCGKDCGQYSPRCDGSADSCKKFCEESYGSAAERTACSLECESKPCQTCCTKHCENNFEGTDQGKTACFEVCMSGCGYKKMTGSVETLIYAIAGILGAIMIIIHAFRLATSSDAHARSEAKRSIAYVIIALIIVALAMAIIGLFTNISGVAKPEPCITSAAFFVMLRMEKISGFTS